MRSLVIAPCIDLDNNKICDDGAISLADALTNNSTIDGIYLDSNNISCNSAKLLSIYS